MCWTQIGHQGPWQGPRGVVGTSVLFSGEGASACLVVPWSLLKALFDPILHGVL